MNWDDTKVFLAVARRRKLAAAAADVKMDVTTISRRIKRLEDSIGQTLFERLRSGHVLTANGEDLFALAEKIESQFDRVLDKKSASAHAPSGTIRLSVAEGFGTEILAPILGRFSQAYPYIDIDLVSGSGFLSLSKREADIAIGLSRSKSKQINSELLTRYKLHLYGHRDYLQISAAIVQLRDLADHTLIDYVDDLIYAEELRYFEKHLPHHRPKIRSTSIMAQKKLVESGAGLAILPDFLASIDLNRVLPDAIQLERQFWFSCHQSVEHLEKIKVFKTFAFAEMGSEKS